MALSIKNPQAEQLAAKVTEKTGETITRAVIVALEERLERLTGARRVPDLEKAIMEISRRCSVLPDLDSRTPDQILGYNKRGTFEEDRW